MAGFQPQEPEVDKPLQAVETHEDCTKLAVLSKKMWALMWLSSFGLQRLRPSDLVRHELPGLQSAYEVCGSDSSSYGSCDQPSAVYTKNLATGSSTPRLSHPSPVTVLPTAERPAPAPECEDPPNQAGHKDEHKLEALTDHKW